ncbi:probable methyltransferase-like protein 24 isoform X1 [Mya arenaria]|uniref:probable methyltransferase-like protein 24 isoform X1 n=2 Tax=Mya arenaria TaxID=6604 RepID=UPI0022E5E1A6|nr:probable methyltransferase-like protein 24 isoform X1 [Mya arenaria]
MAIARRSLLLQWCIVGISVPILFVTYKVTMFPMVVTEAEPEIQCLPADFRDTQFIVGIHRNASVLIPEDLLLKTLSREDLSALYHRYLENVQYMCRRKVRLGNYEDGGWDICDDAHFRPPKPCIIYSFGINNDFSFDDAAVKHFGCSVHSFDPSMHMDDHQRSDKNYFHSLGISDKDEAIKANTDEWQLFTYNTIRQKLQHANKTISILKMDVELYEWRVLVDIVKTANMTGTNNLAIEFHLALDGTEVEWEQYYRALTVLRNLYHLGYRIFWTHQNPNCAFVSACKMEQRSNCHEISFVKVTDPF